MSGETPAQRSPRLRKRSEGLRRRSRVLIEQHAQLRGNALATLTTLADHDLQVSLERQEALIACASKVGRDPNIELAKLVLRR